MKTKTFNGGAMAAMVAGLFAMTAATAAVAADQSPAGDKAEVKCVNSSSCKGHGACK
jgi:hypothetical protein